jgi:hypothetical protein
LSMSLPPNILMSVVCPGAVPAAQGLIRDSGNFVLPCPAPCIFATKRTPGGQLTDWVLR